MVVRSTQCQNRAVRSTQRGGGCHPHRFYDYYFGILRDVIIRSNTSITEHCFEAILQICLT